MDLTEKIILDWILYNNKMTYTFKTRCKIKKFVNDHQDIALEIVAYLYALKRDSSIIINAAHGHNFLEEMDILHSKIKKYCIGNKVIGQSVTEKLEEIKEKFLTDNVNKYNHEDLSKQESYLENKLIEAFSNANIYEDQSREYNEVIDLIKKRPDDVFEALFIINLQRKNLEAILEGAIKRNNLDKDLNRYLVVARESKIIYGEKYDMLKNEFAISFTSKLKKEVIDTKNYEEEKQIKEWLNPKEYSNVESLLINWWKVNSEFKEDDIEYKKVLNIILEDSEKFLNALMAMFTLGVNITDTINMTLRGNEFELDELIKFYNLASINLGIVFENKYNKEEFIELLSDSLKRERRK